MLRYHARTFELIGRTPRVSADSVAALQAVEHAIGVSLPPSVVEWYSLEGAFDILARYSNDDSPVPIATLGRDAVGQRRDELVRCQMLVFRHENQGVCNWGVTLDGADDPPVVVEFQTGFRFWKSCGVSFSEHLYTCAFDHGFVLRTDHLVQAQTRSLSSKAIKFLGSHFTAEPQSRGWPTERQYRFVAPKQRVLIWADEDRADWWLAADDADSLAELVETVRHVDEVAQALRAS